MICLVFQYPIDKLLKYNKYLLFFSFQYPSDVSTEDEKVLMYHKATCDMYPQPVVELPGWVTGLQSSL